MKKYIALIIIVIFVFSLVPLAFAQDTDTEVRTRAEQRNRLEDTRIKNEERLAKIEGLDQAQIERLSKLKIKNIDKIIQLKGERLERLANLSKEKLERLSELEKEKLDRIAGLNGTELEKLATLSRARLKAFSEKDNERLKIELKDMIVVKVRDADDLHRRNVPQARLQAVRQNFEKAKEKFKEAKDELQDTRNKLREARSEEEKLQHAKNYSLKVADVLIQYLEKVKAKVQESKNIDEARATQIVADIDLQISEITQIKVDIEAATTKEQVKDAAKKLREKWNKLKHITRLHAERVISARIEGLVNRGIVLEKKLDHILAKAEEKGIEINVSVEVAQFSEKIALAKDKYTQAQAKIASVIDLKAGNATNEQIRAVADEANALLKEARDAIKEAHSILKTIVSKIKQAEPEADLSEDVEVEVTQETSTSANVEANAST